VPVGEDPAEALRAQHGMAIDAWTGFSRWDGRPPDYGDAVSCLMAATTVAG
jgi:hypothetical protein